MSVYVLRLYVTGDTERSKQVIVNLRNICENELKSEYKLEVIDILKHPQLAEDEKILATPTLIKQLPPPIRRIIGDMSSTERVLIGLDLKSKNSKNGDEI